MHPDRAKLRDGGTVRARYFRTKDEILEGVAMEDIAGHALMTHPGYTALYREHRDVLDRSRMADDEAAEKDLEVLVVNMRMIAAVHWALLVHEWNGPGVSSGRRTVGARNQEGQGDQMDQDKAKLREGDSARARFFRRKDELFGGEDGGMKALATRIYVDGDPAKGMTEQGSKAMEALMPFFKEVRASIDELTQSPEDEAALTRGLDRLTALKAKQDEVLPPA